MSKAQNNTNTKSEDPWENLAEHQDLLEELAESDFDFADYAQSVLDGLEKRGYR